MKNWTTLMLLVAALAFAACGSEGGTVSTDVEEGDSRAVDGEEEFGCQTADDCMGKQAPDACEKVDCVQNTCTIVPDTTKNGQVCEAEDPCLDNTTCFQGGCLGDVKECSDGNACTDDSCDAESGECLFENNTKPCDDTNPCTSEDQCLDGACQGGESICECKTDEECEQYDDGNPCNGIVTCQAGACETDPATVVDCSGVDVAACEVSYCDENEGICKVKNADDGTACDSDDLCLADSACDNGDCAGTPIKCDDTNKCTNDSCDPADGCVYDSVDNGTECSDGSLCTENDVCTDGECVGDVVEACDSCTTDEDCQAYEDGNACNGTLKCTDSECVVDEETVVVCDGAGDQCKEVKCIPATGKCEGGDALDGTACNDENECTDADYCSGGTCKGLPVDCDDNKACTADSCDPDAGCEYAPLDNDCGDGDPCTINDTCDNGECVGDPNPECQCETNEDCVENEDGDICNGTLVCEDKKCVLDLDTVIDCGIEGMDSCVAITCEPETGECVSVKLVDGDPCDDENACTDDDQCFDGICKGEPMFCDDGNICTDDSCNVNLGCVYSYNATDCDDGSTCTLDDYCQEGICTGDANPDCQCQDDADCDDQDDQNACNGTLVCKAFKCQVDPETVVECDKSDDGDCMYTYCMPDTGACVTTDFENGKPCSDDDVCTLIDTCVDGECVGALAPVCDDGNPCTDDACDAALGCIAVDNSSSCDDGDPCTGGDACADGVCQPGPNPLCADTCIPDWTLTCGGTDAWGTDMSGATDVVEEYACSPYAYTGPEYTYTWTAEFDAVVTVSLSGEEADTDLIVLESMGEGCDPEQCRDWDFSKVTFEAVAGQTYYFVVDGYEEGVLPGEGDYTIAIECQPLNELDCGDGMDDDLDGLTDCDDPDCAGTVECPLPVCEPAWNLACGETDSWSNYSFGSTDLIDGYDCNGYGYAAPEYTYVFVAPVSKTITVKLAEETAETDILVLTSGDEGECLPENCVDWGMSEVTFEAVAGETYYLVVDGFAGAEGSYTITVECPPDVEVDCGDDVDNDDDDLTDCDDDDCKFTEACSDGCDPWLYPFEVGCGFEEDYFNYSFFATDNADTYGCTEDVLDGPEYVYNFVAPYDGNVTVTLTEETAETDLVVVEAGADDACLTVNCLDHDFGEVTFEAEEGKLYFVIVDGFAGAEGSYHIAFVCNPDEEMDCTDGLDDDDDGLTDCVDDDCFPGPDCQDACEPDTVEFAMITCDSTDSWSTDGGGGANLVDAYSCNPYNYEGSEYTYTLTVDGPETVTVMLDNELDDDDDPAELDLLVLADDGLGCNPASCIAYGFSTVTFEADEDTTYFVVVDGYNGAEGNYDLTVSCD